MTNTVSDLREMADDRTLDTPAREVAKAAADEIERLRHALAWAVMTNGGVRDRDRERVDDAKRAFRSAEPEKAP